MKMTPNMIALTSLISLLILWCMLFLWLDLLKDIKAFRQETASKASAVREGD